MVTSTLSTANAGTASLGTDVASRVERTLASQSGGIGKLNSTLTRDQTKLSGLGQLRSALASFQSLAKGLAGEGLSTSASALPKTVLTATAGGSAKAGNYAVEVSQLAQGQLLTSDSFAAADGKIGNGASTTVKIEFGSSSAGTFTPGADSAKTITIDSKNNTLAGMAAALKEAGLDATVVKSGSGYALSIAGQSGAAHSMRVSVSGDAAVRAALSYDGAGKGGLNQTAAAQDAVLTVDGKTVKSASNSVSGAIEGATLNLSTKGKSEVKIARDSGQISQNVKTFVAAYNDLNARLQALQKGDLKSDVALGQVSSQLSQLLKTGGSGVSVSALANAGVTLNANGNLALDEKKLGAAVTADASAVAQLFSNDGKGIADQMASKIAGINGDSGVIVKESVSLNKEIAAVNTKRAALSKALTAQASALAALYTQQAQSASGTGSSAPRSLFDMLA